MCFSVSAWDRITPMVLGLPFNLAWLVSWIVLTSVCMYGAYRIETSRIARDSARRGANDSENSPE
jgi:hypothetical protein